MIENITDPKEQLLQTAMLLLGEQHSAARITTRQIAERAGVAVGSINYHFGSKDALLYEAYNRVFMAEVLRWLDDNQAGETDALTRLRGMLQTTATYALENLEIARSGIAYDAQKGDMGTALMLVPLLRVITGAGSNELTVRLQAVALISLLQSILLKKEAFEAYMGIQLDDAAQRDALLEQIFNLIVFSKQGE